MNFEEYNSRGCLPLSQCEANELVCTSGGCNKLDVFNWLNNMPTGLYSTDVVEIRFKNTRKGFYKNINKPNLKKGDIVAVEASPGHDIGIVSLTGELVRLQMQRYKIDSDAEMRKVYRKAKPADVEKWQESIALEHSVMLQARIVASEMRLSMKIGDVEFQGDRTKAIFYYIADERVDFRELIKVLAEKFKIRIEMRQIGARQEAGRIGGIASCGRELCCATWITNFVSVTTNAARYQELSLNPQKLAGQCSKLKCCLNYELESYRDALKEFPQPPVALRTKEGIAYHLKTDIFKQILWYSFEQESTVNMIPLKLQRVLEIIELNAKGIAVERLDSKVEPKKMEKLPDYENVVGQESVTRFDDNNKNNLKKKRKKKRKKPAENKPVVQ